jgi:hypothetical protein
VRDFGSNTSAPRLARLVAHRVEQVEHRLLRAELLGRERLLAGLSFGLVSSSISSTFWPDVPGGSSVTTSCHWPRARSSIFQRAHLQAAAAGFVRRRDFSVARDDLAAAGEVRAGDQFISSRA